MKKMYKQFVAFVLAVMMITTTIMPQNVQASSTDQNVVQMEESGTDLGGGQKMILLQK